MGFSFSCIQLTQIGGLGFAVVIVIAQCMSSDIESILNSRFGQPVSDELPFPPLQSTTGIC